MFSRGDARSPGLLARLRSGLVRTQAILGLRLREVFRGRTRVDDELLEDLRAALLEADVGVRLSDSLLAALIARVRTERIEDADAVRRVLVEELRSRLVVAPTAPPAVRSVPHVVLVVGVNGVGKTTTIGKLARLHAAAASSVLVCAGDTFRAAATEQLAAWAERAGARLVKHGEGADPAAVVFDALETALAKRFDVVIVDTAGRLHTKDNLMAELDKIRRVIAKRVPGAPHETLLVLDATTGQNALSQAREFAARVGLTGLVVTKLDGTAKGGVVAAIATELKLPVRYVGTGEGLDDLVEFDAASFAEALFS